MFTSALQRLYKHTHLKTDSSRGLKYTCVTDPEIQCASYKSQGYLNKEFLGRNPLTSPPVTFFRFDRS